MTFVCILGEVNISYIFCFIFRDLLTFSVTQIKTLLWFTIYYGSTFNHQKNVYQLLHVYCVLKSLLCWITAFQIWFCKLYIPSTVNTDYLLWHTKIVCCVCSILNHGLNHGLLFSLFKFFG